MYKRNSYVIIVGGSIIDITMLALLFLILVILGEYNTSS